MTEQALKDYFESKISANDLAKDLKDSQISTGYNGTSIHITDIQEEGEFNVTRQHLLKLCNDTLAGSLTTLDLNTISFGLFGSDFFQWDNETEDGAIVDQTLFEWGNPEINYPITVENLLLWEKYLMTGKHEFN